MAEGLPDVQQDIERALGLEGGDQGNLGQAAVHEVPPLFKGLAHFLHAGLVSVQGGQAGILGDGVGVAGGVALEGGHGGNDGPGPGRVAQPPAGHGVGLAEAADDDGLLKDPPAQSSDGDMLLAVVDELFVDLIADYVKLVMDRQVGQHFELVPAPDRAGGVVGGVQHQGLGAGRDGLFNLGAGGHEALLLGGVDPHGHAARHLNHFRIADPAGAGNQHLVAGVEDGLQCAQNDLLGPVADDDLLAGVGKALVLEQEVGHGQAQAGHTAGGGVFGFPVVDGFFTGLPDVLRGDEVRLARAQGNDVFPAVAHFGDDGVHFQRDGGRDVLTGFGERQRHKENLPVP